MDVDNMDDIRVSQSELPGADNALVAALQSRVNYYETLGLGERCLDPRPRVAEMDAELLSVDTVLADFRRRRNSLIPASACPPEVLSSIFRSLAHEEPNYHPDPEDYLAVVTRERGPRLGWLKATQVCHSWRAAACMDGALWTMITTTLGMEYATKMLQLSRSLPLSLDIVLDKRNLDPAAAMSMIEGHVGRLSRLQILCDGHNRQSLTKLCHQPAPQLRSLLIFTRGFESFPDPNLFAGQMPSLDKLYLRNAMMPLDTLRGLARLTQLTLITDAGTSGSIAFGKFAELLSALPNLEALCVKNFIMDVTEADVPLGPTTPINCSRLVDITCHPYNANAAMLLLSRLSHHPSARISLAGCFTVRWRGEHIDQILALLRLHLESLSSRADIHTVEWRSFGYARIPLPDPEDQVDAVHERTLVLSAWRENNADYLLADHEGYNAPPRPDFTLTLGWEAHTSSEVDPEVLLPWPTLFSSARSVSLQTSKYQSFNVYDWGSTIGNLSHLEFLRVDRELAESFLQNNVSWLMAAVPRALKVLAVLGVSFGTSPGVDNSPDRCLADIWSIVREEGGVLEKVIVGDLNYEGGDFDPCVEQAGVRLTGIARPAWLREGHEDHDDRTEL
ncbi:unnamed protein product [Peniophora sp. CBMAI 1063]|nr:unnamed protein product [Peniophora sp. CBMAI 1063]